MPLSSIGRRHGIPYGEAIDLVLGLLRDPRSHLRMEMLRMRVAYTVTDVYMLQLATFVINYLRKQGSEPLKVPEDSKPKPPERVKVTVTDGERARAAAMLSSIGLADG